MSEAVVTVIDTEPHVPCDESRQARVALLPVSWCDVLSFTTVTIHGVRQHRLIPLLRRGTRRLMGRLDARPCPIRR